MGTDILVKKALKLGILFRLDLSIRWDLSVALLRCIVNSVWTLSPRGAECSYYNAKGDGINPGRVTIRHLVQSHRA